MTWIEPGRLMDPSGLRIPQTEKEASSRADAVSHNDVTVSGSRSGRGQSETNVTTEPWSAVEWIADADLTRASFYWDSVPHCRNQPPIRRRIARAIF